MKIQGKREWKNNEKNRQGGKNWVRTILLFLRLHSWIRYIDFLDFCLCAARTHTRILPIATYHIHCRHFNLLNGLYVFSTFIILLLLGICVCSGHTIVLKHVPAETQPDDWQTKWCTVNETKRNRKKIWSTLWQIQQRAMVYSHDCWLSINITHFDYSQGWHELTEYFETQANTIACNMRCTRLRLPFPSVP